MKETNTRVRRNGGSKTAPVQSPNKPDTFVVTITDAIRESAKEAGETIKQFVETAIRHKLITDEMPLQLFLKLSGDSERDLHVDREGRMFLWKTYSDSKPDEVSLADAIGLWRVYGSENRYFEDFEYIDGTPADQFMRLLSHHWRVLHKAETSRV